MTKYLMLIATFCVSAALAHGCGTTASSGGVDSETHFMDPCDEGCPAGLACVCGVCTKACGRNEECAGLATGQALCSRLSGGGCAEPVNACAVPCSTSEACAPLEEPTIDCRFGLCQSQRSALKPALAANSGGAGGVESAGGAGGVESAGGASGSSGSPELTNQGGQAGAAPVTNAERARRLARELTDAEIWAAALDTNAPGIGQCRIEDGRAQPVQCDYYAKCADPGTDAFYGWPKNPEGGGTGCIYSPDSARAGFCTLADTERFCTGSAQANAANHIRDALEHDVCGTVGDVADYR